MLSISNAITELARQLETNRVVNIVGSADMGQSCIISSLFDTTPRLYPPASSCLVWDFAVADQDQVTLPEDDFRAMSVEPMYLVLQNYSTVPASVSGRDFLTKYRGALDCHRLIVIHDPQVVDPQLVPCNYSGNTITIGIGGVHTDDFGLLGLDDCFAFTVLVEMLARGHLQIPVGKFIETVRARLAGAPPPSLPTSSRSDSESTDEEPYCPELDEPEYWTWL